MTLKNQSRLKSSGQSTLVAQGDELSSCLFLHPPSVRMQREAYQKELCCHHLSRSLMGAEEVHQHQKNPELLLPLKMLWTRAVTCPTGSLHGRNQARTAPGLLTGRWWTRQFSPWPVNSICQAPCQYNLTCRNADSCCLCGLCSWQRVGWSGCNKSGSSQLINSFLTNTCVIGTGSIS